MFAFALVGPGLRPGGGRRDPNQNHGRGHHGRMDGGCSKLIVKVFGGVGLESSWKNEGDRGALDTLVYHFRFGPFWRQGKLYKPRYCYSQARKSGHYVPA